MKNKNPDKRSKKALFDFSSKLAKTILNYLSANTAILDENGVILETNEAWKNFAMKNEIFSYLISSHTKNFPEKYTYQIRPNCEFQKNLVLQYCCKLNKGYNKDIVTT